MKKIKAFARESYTELKKVSWPSRESVYTSMKIVLVFTLFAAIFFKLADFLLFEALSIFF